MVFGNCVPSLVVENKSAETIDYLQVDVAVALGNGQERTVELKSAYREGVLYPIAAGGKATLKQHLDTSMALGVGLRRRQGAPRRAHDLRGRRRQGMRLVGVGAAVIKRRTVRRRRGRFAARPGARPASDRGLSQQAIEDGRALSAGRRHRRARPHHRRVPVREARPADHRPEYRRRLEHRGLRHGAPRRSRRLHAPVQCQPVRAGQDHHADLPLRSADRLPADRPGGRGAAGAAGQLNVPGTDYASTMAAIAKEPKKYFFALSSGGSAGHIATLAFLKRTGLPLDTILYKGTAPANADLLAATCSSSWIRGRRCCRSPPRAGRAACSSPPRSAPSSRPTSRPRPRSG